MIDTKTGSFTLRALFPNTDYVLRSGGTGNVLIPSQLDSALMVPQKATSEIQDKKFVYVLQPDSTVKNTPVEVFNLDDGKNYVVTSGLRAGDRIVVEGVATLKDGAKIKAYARRGGRAAECPFGAAGPLSSRPDNNFRHGQNKV